MSGRRHELELVEGTQRRPRPEPGAYVATYAVLALAAAVLLIVAIALLRGLT